MTWTPPDTFEEKLKKHFVPPDLYIRYLYLKELKKGEQEIRLIPHLANANRAALDIGANKGVYTFALLRSGVRNVHAFEPNPKIFRTLERWSRPKVTLHQMALGDTSDRANLMVPKSEKGYSNQGASLSRVKLGEQRYDVIEIESSRLDDLDIPDVGFMKIDVEGYESNVLRGAVETLRRDRPNLLVEIEEKHTGRKLDDIVDEIRAFGYECFALLENVLTRFDRIDLERHHRHPAKHADYVFNFLFFPR